MPSREWIVMGGLAPLTGVAYVLRAVKAIGYHVRDRVKGRGYRREGASAEDAAG